MFKIKNASLYVTAGLFLLAAVSCAVTGESKKAVAKKRPPGPFEQNKRIGRGINLGNALDAPNEGEWGVTLKEEYFKIIKEAGFDSVRIPIRWSAHALENAPYTIEKSFFDRVDWAIENALKNDLYVILNIHHYLEIMEDPANHQERFYALWEQIAEHYKDYPDSVLFELINEPDGKLSRVWNETFKKALAIVRKSNPHRTVVIDPAEDSVIKLLKKLDIPKEERDVIVSVHYYTPLEFTHQGAEWVGEKSTAWLGTTWTGTEKEKVAITKAFDEAAAWSKENNRPINLGEFGVYEKADMDSRANWTEFVVKSAVERGWSFSYWEFCSGFGAYDQETNTWRKPLLNALIPSEK
ncbi:MAG: glycoside hydrolase family 5 protein [Sedimentisphaerales bacterium]|nr:glycoside hydrolase family 5 protein [Sedimentisphaerales bacterium]